MTVAELIAHLSKFDGRREVVLDVNLEHCDSDRNILAIAQVGDFHPETGLVFLDSKIAEFGETCDRCSCAQYTGHRNTKGNWTVCWCGHIAQDHGNQPIKAVSL